MKKAAFQGAGLVIASVCLSLGLIEAVLRISRGKLLDSSSVTAEREQSQGRMSFDPHLGWVPRSSQEAGWSAHVDSLGFRRGEGQPQPTGQTILAIGDSFTFGDEVEDGESWPARLEARLNAPVLNAGVGAYGIDQAVLRGEQLLDTYHPGVVILPVISDNINRTEFSYYPYGRGAKPYFLLDHDTLTLRNDPVSPAKMPVRFGGARHLLGYSHVAGIVFSRLAPSWWLGLPEIQHVHGDGDAVSAALLIRFDSVARAHGAKFVAVALATNGHIGDKTDRLPALVQRVRARGVKVFDLSAEIGKRSPAELRNAFRPRGHYSPEMNAWVADRIALFLRDSVETVSAFAIPSRSRRWWPSRAS